MSEIEVNEVQTDVPADVIDPIKVIYEGECSSISGRSTLAFAVGRHADDKSLHLAITGNSGKGMFAADWAPASAIQEVVLGAFGLTGASFHGCMRAVAVILDRSFWPPSRRSVWSVPTLRTPAFTNTFQVRRSRKW